MGDLTQSVERQNLSLPKEEETLPGAAASACWPGLPDPQPCRPIPHVHVCVCIHTCMHAHLHAYMCMCIFYWFCFSGITLTDKPPKFINGDTEAGQVL